MLQRFPYHSHQHADHTLDLTNVVFGIIHRDDGIDEAQKLSEVACGDSAIHGMNGVVLLPIELLHCDHLSYALDDTLPPILILRFHYDHDRCFNRSL